MKTGGDSAGVNKGGSNLFLSRGPDFIAEVSVFLLGFALRFYHLGRESLWLDEANSLAWASISDYMEVAFPNDVHPPFYFLLLKVWTALFGKSEFSLRFPSLVFGLLTLIFFYLFLKEVFSRRVALFSVFLLAISPFHIRYSQEARGYSLLAFLVLGSMYFLYKLLKNHGRKYQVLYFLFSFLMLMTHYYGFFYLAAQWVFVVLFYWRSKDILKRWFTVQFLILIFYLPWLIWMIKTVQKIYGHFWPPRASLNLLWKTAVVYSGGELEVSLMFLLLFMGLFRSLKENPRLGVYFLLWLILPVFLPFLISFSRLHIFLRKCTIGAFIPFVAFVGLGVEELKGIKHKLTAMLLIGVFLFPQLKSYYSVPQKEQWREVVSFIEKRLRRGDVVVLTPEFLAKAFSYYSRKRGFKRDVIEWRLLGNPGKIEEKVKEEILGKPVKRMWLITSHLPAGALKNVLQVLKKFGVVAGVRHFKGISVFEIKFKNDFLEKRKIEN